MGWEWWYLLATFPSYLIVNFLVLLKGTSASIENFYCFQKCYWLNRSLLSGHFFKSFRYVFLWACGSETCIRFALQLFILANSSNRNNTG